MKSELEYGFIETDCFKLNKTVFIQSQCTSKALHLIISAISQLNKCGSLVMEKICVGPTSGFFGNFSEFD